MRSPVNDSAGSCVVLTKILFPLYSLIVIMSGSQQFNMQTLVSLSAAISAHSHVVP